MQSSYDCSDELQSMSLRFFPLEYAIVSLSIFIVPPMPLVILWKLSPIVSFLSHVFAYIFCIFCLVISFGWYGRWKNSELSRFWVLLGCLPVFNVFIECCFRCFSWFFMSTFLAVSKKIGSMSLYSCPRASSLPNNLLILDWKWQSS